MTAAQAGTLARSSVACALDGRRRAFYPDAGVMEDEEPHID
jgi:hypothetical protein